jgi:hypothetical protein
LFLRKAIEVLGTVAINYWSGCKYETHDFYIKGNAVEIKTSSKKSPYKMHISSEYQLDYDDVSKALYIVFYALRKSEADGERLPEIIADIREKLVNQPLLLQKFSNDLEEYGYFDGLEDKYITGYIVRDELIFEVFEKFPSIVRKDLQKGITNCTYDLLVDVCKEYKIQEKALMERLKGN